MPTPRLGIIPLFPVVLCCSKSSARGAMAAALGLIPLYIARPADLERKDIDSKKLQFNSLKIAEEFARCHEEETENFHVYTITHKFDPEFHVEHNFTKCLASPLMLPILTDGNAYICPDKKMEQPFKLGSAYPNPEEILTWWGSEEHRELIKSVNINNCSRCTWCKYNEQIEQIVLEDSMNVCFP